MTQFDPDAPTEALTLNDGINLVHTDHEIAMIHANAAFEDVIGQSDAAGAMSESLKLFLHADR